MTIDFDRDLQMEIGGIMYTEREVAKIVKLAHEENISLMDVDMVLEKLGPMIRAAVHRSEG
jgi:hypothetical protein